MADDTDNPLHDLMPESPLTIPAWLGCLQWAIGEEKVLDAFHAETGKRWARVRTPLDRMTRCSGRVTPAQNTTAPLPREKTGREAVV